MAKIYSRKRIKIFCSSGRKIKKKIAIVIIIVVAGLTIMSSVKSVDPIYEELCKAEANNIATKILNEESTKVVQKNDYKDIITITKNDNNNTSVLKTDVTVLNDIASDIAVEVVKRLKQEENEKIKIPLGALLGNKYLSGFGPKINISIIQAGNIETEVKTEFKAQGINQTIYRIYLEVKCNMNIVASFKTMQTEIANQILLVETVIVGDVPETYYDLEGAGTQSILDIIE